MAYIGNSPGTATQRIVDIFTATAGQTVFTPSNGYFLGYVDVIVNGSDLINGVDYTANNGTTITLTESAALNDSVKIVTFIPRGLTDGYLKSEADALFLSADETTTLTNKTINVDNNTVSGIAASSFVLSNSSGNIDGSVAQKVIPSGVVVGTTDTQTLTNKNLGSGTSVSAEVTNTATSSLQVPVGTTAQRPTGADGKVRYNTDLDKYEGYNGSSWLSLGGGAVGGGSNAAFYENDTTISSDYTITSGKNAMSAGPITVNSGVTVTIPSGSCWTIVGS
jgi:hypothetical protein